MGEKVVSITDVAERAGVSPATVSNVLTGRKSVSPRLAKKVHAAVKALDYRRDPLASMLRSGEAKIVAVLVPDLDNPFFTSIVSTIEDCVGKSNYEVIVASSHGEDSVERSRLKAILAWRPAGLIVIPCSDEFSGRSVIDASSVPYVIADRVTKGSRADTVSVDNQAAGSIGMRHLIELGHENTLIAASSLKLANMRQRCEGAEKAARAAGLSKPAIVEVGFDVDVARQRLLEWFERRPRPTPTAIQSLTNFTTLSALTAIAERGLRIPDHISLIGFDDYAWMSARATPLTAICQPVREMGRLLWERLSARISGDTSPAVHLQLPCELRIRASTADIRSLAPANSGASLAARPPRVATRRPRKSLEILAE